MKQRKTTQSTYKNQTEGQVLRVGKDKEVPTTANKFSWFSIPINIMRNMRLYFFLVSLLLYFLITRLGFGKYFVHQEFLYRVPMITESDIEVVAELPLPPGNLAVSSSGRIFFNFHPEFSPSPTKVAELINTESWRPYPSDDFQKKIITVLSIRIHNDILWLLDFAQHGLLGKPKLFGFRLSTDELIAEHIFDSSVAGIGSMLNDFQIDPSGKYIYIADTSIVGASPAIILYSIENGNSFRILNKHTSLFGNSLFLNVSDKVTKFGPFGFKIHVDSIALSRDGKNLFFGAVTSPNLYTIPTHFLIRYIKLSEKRCKE